MALGTKMLRSRLFPSGTVSCLGCGGERLGGVGPRRHMGEDRWARRCPVGWPLGRRARVAVKVRFYALQAADLARSGSPADAVDAQRGCTTQMRAVHGASAVPWGMPV